MSYILSIEALRNVYTAYRFSSKFIFATEDVIEKIGSNEFNAALRSLKDMRISDNPERELNMAITQFRSSLEHFVSKSQGIFASYNVMKKQFQTALLISICYYCINERALCEQYRALSVNYFSEWLESYSNGCPSGKLYNLEIWYDETKKEVIDLGLSWNYSYPDSGFFDLFSDKAHRRFREAFRSHKEAIKNQYIEFTYKVTS